MAIGSFASFVLLDPQNNILDPQTAFVSLSLFNTLQAPLLMLPLGIVSIIQGAVSVRRINKATSTSIKQHTFCLLASMLM